MLVPTDLTRLEVEQMRFRLCLKRWLALRCLGHLVLRFLVFLIAGTAIAHAQSKSGFGPSSSLESGDSVTEDIAIDDDWFGGFPPHGAHINYQFNKSSGESEIAYWNYEDGGYKRITSFDGPTTVVLKMNPRHTAGCG